MTKHKRPDQVRKQIVAHLEDFPRQLQALETAMEAFGEGFELSEFKPAFNGKRGMNAYLQVQALERAFSRVQNYMSQLALDGTMLAGVDLPRLHESDVARAFEALKQKQVLNPSLCRRLKKAQSARSAVEHDYLGMRAGEVHRAIAQTAASAREFIGPYTAWIKQYL
jgi:hypothetical protein